jgi:amino acid transporter
MSQEETLLSELGYKQQLKRAYGIWQLTAFGLNYMIPIAPAIIFGFVLQTSGGTVALPYLIALFGMLFTAFGYTYFIKQYPVAGSSYTYIAKAISTQIGFIGGWGLLLDYILIPTLTSMSASFFLHNLIPQIPYELILIIFIATTGTINLIGSKPLAQLGLSLLVLGEIVIFVGFAVWSHAIVTHHIGVGHLLSSEPFHFTNVSTLTSATSIAMLSYLGFDAITTLAEEAKTPRQDIPRAIFLSLIIGSVTMFLTGYLGMLVIPNWHLYINDPNWVNTTLFFVSQTTGGKPLVLFYTIGFVIAMGVFNVVATTGASRLLFGMSRDGTIPFAFLNAISKKTHIPFYNVILIVLLQLVVGSLFSLEIITEIVNFGALFGFTLLNIATFWHIYNHYADIYWEKLTLLIPILGVLINFWILIHLGTIALIVGTIWLLIGFIFYHTAIMSKNLSNPEQS